MSPEELLRQAALEGKLVVFAGAGVTMAATPDTPEASWIGLLRSGFQYCEQRKGTSREVLDSGAALIKAERLVLAAELLTDELGGSGSGAFRAWLESTVATFDVRDPDLTDAIQALGARIVTTNYDDVLCKATGLTPITWKNSGDLASYLHGTLQGILHLHGHWRTTPSVVLGLKSYDEILRDDAAKHALRTFFSNHTVLFVGCGQGLNDPNFRALREWMRRALRGDPESHWVLVREGELESARTELASDPRLEPLSFGATHPDLPGFLRKLAPKATTSTKPAATPGVQAKSAGEAALRRYLASLAGDVRDLLLDRFRIGSRPERDDEVEQRLLSQVYVQLDLHGDRRRIPEQDVQASLVEQAIAENSFGSGLHTILWSPPGKTILEWGLAEASPVGGTAPFELLPINLPHAPMSAETVAVLAHAYARAQAEGDPESALASADARRRLVLVVQNPSVPDPFGPGWADLVRGLRSRWPHVRVIGVLRAHEIALEHLLLLDPAVHQLPGRYVLRGHPGTGKTTILRHAVLQGAQQALAGESDARIPLYVSLPTWARKRCSLAELLADEHAVHCDKETFEALLQGPSGRLLLLFDGLDEVRGDEAREWIASRLREVPGTWPEARAVVATRKIPYRPFAPLHYAEVDILPLDEERQRRLLDGWLRSGGRAQDPTALTARILRDLDAGGAAFRELREVPLLLTFVAMLYEDADGDSGFRLHGRRSDLYRGILEHLRQGRHRRPPRAMDPPNGSHRALRLLARACTVEEGEEPTRGDLIAVLSRTWDSQELDDVRSRWRDHEGRPDVSGFLRELADTTGILGGPARDEARWSFWHRTLREALVAEQLAEEARSPEGTRRVLALARELRGKEAQWAEPFALFVGQTDPNRWLLELAEQNPALALRALGTAEGVWDTTVEKVLQLEGLDAEERCRQYGSLRERVQGDAESAARLLGRLAARTDGCMDLWHVAKALDELLHSEPGAGDAVHSAREHLFAHESFGARIAPDSLTVPGHPQHAFWRRVPAGTRFRMGSPENEVGRWGDEGPMAELTIEIDYDVAAVPITNRMWKLFRPSFDADAASSGPDAPVTEVDWYDAAMFCAWLGARLPSDAEWECARRAGTTTRYWPGDGEKDLARVGWYDENSGRRLHAVAEKPANPFGLFDVHGNVWEWCEDDWSGDYSESGKVHRGPYRLHFAGIRVNRGGSFNDTARDARSAYFHYSPPRARTRYLGFRPAKGIEP